MKTNPASKIFMVVIMMLLFVGAKAQIFHAGPMAGIGLQYMRDPNIGAEMGGYIGLITDFKLHKLISIQPSLEYAWKGYDASSSVGILSHATKEKDLNLNYFVLNLPFKLTIYNRWYITAGPQMGILCSAKFNSRTKFIGSNDINKYDYGIFAGTGFQLNGGLSLYINIERGLRTVGKDGYKQDNNGPDLSGKNELATAGISILINYDD